VRRAIRVHRRDFIAIVVLFCLAIGVSGYIFLHQPAFTLFKHYYTVYAQFSQASAVTSGQGQTVDIAGVTVGQVGGVTVQNGRAVVKMNIYTKYQPIYRDATVLLRPRTPLKDMYLALDPGTKSAGAIPAGGMLGAGATNPDVDFSEILSALDSDTRDYLLLLLEGGAQAFKNPGNPGPLPSPSAVADLRGVFQRFPPLNRDTATLTRLLAERTTNIRRSINGLRKVTEALGSVQGAFTSLINSSNTNFQAIASQSTQLQQALVLLPPTLQQSITTYNKLRPFAIASTNSATALLPWAESLKPALVALRPLFNQTTPVIQNQLKPFTLAVKPVAQVLAPAAEKLAQATPPLERSIGVLNTLFNTIAYQKPGGEPGYLFWGSWLSHVADLLTAQQDTHGPIVRGTFMASCTELHLFEVTLIQSTPSIGNLLQLLNAPNWETTPVTKNGMCTVG
jgi:phospholipid/cholesterol/gamma-HCH transport system substrate-binding protein